MNLTPEQAIPDIGQGGIGDVQWAFGPIQAAAAPTAPPAGHRLQGLFRPEKFPGCAGLGGPCLSLFGDSPLLELGGKTCSLLPVIIASLPGLARRKLN